MKNASEVNTVNQAAAIKIQLEQKHARAKVSVQCNKINELKDKFVEMIYGARAVAVLQMSKLYQFALRATINAKGTEY